MSRLSLLLLLALPLAAQEENNYIFKLDNGAQVLYQVYSEIDLGRKANEQKVFGSASASGNVIRRSMRDDKGNAWLAFELHIDRKPGSGPIRFLISMQPMGGAAFFGQRADPREIENGDRILLDVLEEPGTGRKIFDTFQVGIGTPMQLMPMPRSVPRIPAPGTIIHLQNPRFWGGVNVLAKASGTVSGAKVALSVAERGRFVFASQPEPGFRMEAIGMEGTVEGTPERYRLMWVVGKDMFDVFLSAPVIEGVKSCYLWVKKEALESQPDVPNLYLIKVQ